MPEGVGYGPQSTFTGSSNSLITIGKHAYAFGGVVEVTNANEKILSFSTGKEYFVGKLQVSTPSESTDDIDLKLNIADLQQEQIHQIAEKIDQAAIAIGRL